MTTPAPSGIPDDDRYDLGILVVLRVVAQRWWLILIVVVLSGAMTVRRAHAVSSMYEASTLVQVTEGSKDWTFGVVGTEALDPIRAIETQIQVAMSHPVWEGAWQRLGVERSKKIADYAVAGSGGADVLVFKVQSTDPRLAEDAAVAFAESYVEVRRDQVSSELRIFADFLTERSSAYEEEVGALDVQIAERSGRDQDAEFYRLLASSASPNSALEANVLIGTDSDPLLARLVASREAALSLATELAKRADEVNLEAAALATGPSLMDGVSYAVGPLGTPFTRQMVVAVIAGLAAGLALAFAVDYLDDRMRRRDRVERELVGIPVLGATPTDRSLASRRSRIAALHRPVSATADAYRSIRSALLAYSAASPVQTLLVTSPSRREGKTTVACELAVVMARGGRSVVVVDANLRRPDVHRRFGLEQEPGLSSVLVGEEGLSSCLVDIPLAGSTGRLRVLPSGSLTDGITQVLDGGRMVDVLRAIQADSDLVVIDSTHVNSLADAQVLAGVVDGVIVVARRKVTKRRLLGVALGDISRSGVPVVWAVLNGFGTKDRVAARRAGRRVGEALVVEKIDLDSLQMS
ncbi:MAG: hypothetical protein GY708_01850 [Actinomycetia bacterium]|nr:hypothetical protein [Actinomycetes bacterium]MCP4960988.1 hypothetical protein [Actinomycetes bacterium]